MTKKRKQGPVKQEPVTPMAKQIDRRKFLELGRKYAVIAPPAVGLLIAASDAKAHCIANPNAPAPHSSPSCATNH